MHILTFTKGAVHFPYTVDKNLSFLTLKTAVDETISTQSPLTCLFLSVLLSSADVLSCHDILNVKISIIQ